MELRSSRSRSRTPFNPTDIIEKDVFNKEINQTHARITRSSIIKSSSSQETVQNKSVRIKNKLKQTKIKTSDYSSEDGDNEISSSYIDDNHRNEYLERKSNGNSFSAYKIYKEAQKCWNKYPKTDYTYSPHSKDRVELAPGVINMPNMSRKSIHEMCETNMCSKETNTTTNSTIFHHSEQAKLKPRILFTENNNRHEYSNRNSNYLNTTTISRIFEHIQTLIITMVSLVIGVFEKPHKWVTSIIKILHKITSKVMLMDSWILQGQYKYSKIKAVIALCLVPLMFLAGLWCVSTVADLVPTWKSAPIINAEEAKSLKQIESIINIKLDTPYPIGLSNQQVKQIAHNLKQSLHLEENEEAIIQLILKDPKLIQISTINHASNREIDYDDLINKLVENDKFKKIVTNDKINGEEFSKELKYEIEELKNSLRSMKSENSINFLKLKTESQRCCRRSFIGLEKYVTDIYKDLISKDHFKENFLVWLKTIFVAKEELEERLSASNIKLKDEFSALVENNARHIMDTVALKLGSRLQEGSTERKLPTDEDYIKKLISEAIDIYDADKTGLVDFALESAGGQILSTRCTESYQVSTAVLSIFGIPVWYPTHGPRDVINSKVVPGECWAFQKFPGYLVIQLSTSVNIEAFSYEHVNKRLVANGKIDSAPKHFSIYGLKSEDDKEPVLIGEYTYDILGEPLQFFPAQNRGLTFNIIQLVVNSNHGNNNYTCLYRFRVHGKINQEPT